MNTIPSTDIPVRPPSNETLPPGHVWKSKPATTKANPRRKYAPKHRLSYLFT